MVFVPEVKSLSIKEGRCSLAIPVRIDSRLTVSEVAVGCVKRALCGCGTPAREGMAVSLQMEMRGRGREAYSIKVRKSGVVITAESDAGLFYGTQTLSQIISRYGADIPCLDIEDAPDFPDRGFYHDVTRGKVPTLQTLKYLVDTLSSYKLNQMQLYIEHTYAFSAVPEFGEMFDPLTADDIRSLDAYCRERFIELVPSMATFGHLYELLRIPRFEHLNELDVKASRIPRNLWDRMAHYTIDPSNPESFELIRFMLEEYMSLFSSRRVNICCDETFDLGKGKNREAALRSGTGRLYVEFVKKIAAVVTSAGKTPMMWGDIVLTYPDCIAGLPAGMIYLNWNYRADCTPDASRRFKEAGVQQYVCPGVCGWSRFAHDIETASRNIRRQVQFGRDSDACGVLTTDWGDCGHVNFLSASLHGMALGAALSWNSRSFPTDDEFDAALSSHAWGDASGRLYSILRELGSLCEYHFGNIYAWVTRTDSLWNREKEVPAWNMEDLLSRYNRADSIVGQLNDILGKTSSDKTAHRELLFGGRAIQWTLALMIGKLSVLKCVAAPSCAHPQHLIEDAITLRDEFTLLWLERNRNRELDSVMAVFDAVVSEIRSWPQVQEAADRSRP